MNRAVKIRIYPNKEQRVQIEKTIGCSRFIYNQMLADKISYYQKEKKMLRNTPAGYKKEYPWLKEVDSLALANVQLHLESAFRKFFREPSCGFPRYKSKKTCRKFLYDQCSKREYLFAGYPSEASKDVCHKDKIPPADPVRLGTEVCNCEP